ncbi:MAG TPA: SDR family NAD(P)-dependent oxidoreductase [Rhizobiales bacterium]|nr:SDR family NAD(P)-dependent oxidoreductase [Hyphomicrobiales bacterium]
MTDRSILITGCSTGIGYTCALGMRERGWRVFATARKDEDLARLEELGLEAVYLDYTKPDSIARCAHDVLLRTDNQLYALFNNGAYGQIGAVEDLPVEALRHQFEANVFGWHDLTCRIIPSMRAQGQGRIVQCSSILGLIALKWRGAYNASKFALEGLSDTMRLELAGSGIYVSLIEPGPIRSKFQKTAIDNFEKTIDRENSPHREAYIKQLARRTGHMRTGWEPETPAQSKKRTGGILNRRGRLGPDAVLDKLVHAVESSRPHPHYHVTLPTRIGAFARRVLSGRLFDAFASKIS